MNLYQNLKNKLTIPQWNIGLARGSIAEIIRNKEYSLFCTWMAIDAPDRFYADPFIFNAEDGHFHILYEDFSAGDNYGKIALTTIDQSFKPVFNKIILDTGSHLSYPYIFKENGKVYVLPEAAESGCVSCYEFDFADRSLINKADILKLPLFDSTILKYENKYWLFGTLFGKNSSNMLYIFYADNLFGPYMAHPMNPVRNNLRATRPAGSFIEVDGNIYRPSQNCEEDYGKSISINRITLLNENEFSEEFYMILEPGKKDEYNLNVHTINAIDDIIAIDGVKRHFAPFKKFGSFFKSYGSNNF